MKRTLMISAALALLTPVAANAQETNSDAPAVNAPEAVIYSEDQTQLDDLSVEDLNELQRSRLEQQAYDIAEMTDDDAAIVAEDSSQKAEDPLFTTEDHMATADTEADDEETAMGGPYYETEDDAVADSKLTEEPDTTVTTPENDPMMYRNDEPMMLETPVEVPEEQ